MPVKRLKRLISPDPSTLREGVDFYWENGYMVFTAGYLRRRGYCCGSGCRHCPYKDQAARYSGRP